jgi:hypothetical protein
MFYYEYFVDNIDKNFPGATVKSWKAISCFKKKGIAYSE